MENFLYWLIENWFFLVVMATCIVLVAWAIYGFLGLPTEEQRNKVKEWLIWACIEAEKKLQSETGQLKLRDVYNLFCTVPAFTWVAKVISFELFSDWVSDALIAAKKMLVNNRTLAEYVYGDKTDEEVEKLRKQLESAVE